MIKDDFFKLAVELVAPTLQPNSLALPQGVAQTSVAIRVAYNALLDAHGKLPQMGPAPVA